MSMNKILRVENLQIASESYLNHFALKCDIHENEI